MLNVAILSAATYKGVEYMDSDQFCGLTCHTVMAPEYAAFVDSPHSRVGCAHATSGPAPDGSCRSKLSGVRQVFAVALGTYSRPIPSPCSTCARRARPASRATGPQKFVGDKFIVRTKYADDEANTPSTTVLVMKIGGRTGSGAVGIHGRHLDDEGAHPLRVHRWTPPGHTAG